MDTFTLAADSQPVAAEIRDQVLEPFISATCAMLQEWVNTSAFAQTVFHKQMDQTCADIAALLSINSVAGGSLVLNFPRATGVALAERVLSDTGTELSDSLIYDSLGEIANVIAGHAKALLHGTPYRFTFSTPTIWIGLQKIRPEPTDCLVVVFRSEVGDFVLQLFLHP